MSIKQRVFNKKKAGVLILDHFVMHYTVVFVLLTAFGI